MNECVELEIRVRGREATGYELELHLTQPRDDAEIQLLQGGAQPLALDSAALIGASGDDLAYGRLLSQALFGPQEARAAFSRAVAVAQSLDVPLRLRLDLPEHAPALQALSWERLVRPDTGASLLTGEGVYFSRFLPSNDFHRIQLRRARRELRALVVAVNPTALQDRWPTLAPVDVAGERERAIAALGDIPSETFDPSVPVTLDALVNRLRNGFDILYLACHGGVAEDKPFLLLQNDAGGVDVVGAQEFVTRLAELWQRPRLIVLASCRSADGVRARGPELGTLAALGPGLTNAGIGAVLAMQGDVTMQTVAQFMPVFFRELRTHGVLDRSMAVARGSVQARPDWWAPVLFMRLRTGRLWWYDTGFGLERAEFRKWESLLGSIADSRCTPILGPGLTDPIVGSRRDIARRLAEAHKYPMARHQGEDLPQVAQFLAIDNDPNTAPRLVYGHLCAELIARYARHLPADIVSMPLGQLSFERLAILYDDLLLRAWKRRLVDEPCEPHRVLARMPFPLYVLTNPERLLYAAIADQPPDVPPRDAQVEICRWNAELAFAPSLLEGSTDYSLDPVKPIIYHLFGSLHDRNSLVITEDDYFDFLIGITANKDLIPKPIRRSLAASSLLFLGFQIDDWDFRVLFRSLAAQEGRSRRASYTHVAVQIDPEEGRVRDPEQARKYLNDYFHNAADVSIYWGTVEDFVKELDRQWTSRGYAPAVAAGRG